MTPRPPTISNATILAAARAVFLERGAAATTAEIAQRAGCSEGSLFNRFGSKAELFREAMRYEDEDAPWLALLKARVGQGDVKETLELAALGMVDFFMKIMPLSMMLFSNPKEQEHERGPDSAPMRGLKKMTAYFEAEMRLGRIRRRDPEIVARMFSGALIQYVTFELMYNSSDLMPLSAHSYVRGVVDLMWAGLAPDPP